MRAIRVVIGSSWFLGSALGVFLASGCADDSRKTGTQVQESAEVKARTEDMRNMYKDMKK
jgi:hypothetical protein